MAVAAVVVAAGTVPATAHSKTPGTNSLAAVLAADGDTFDSNWQDYDIVTEAVDAVLGAKPDSAVGVLADGSVAVTAFIPDDRAFRILVNQISGSWLNSEEDVFGAVAGLGIDTVETVLLYHVVPGATIDSATAAKSDGAALTTAAGAAVTVDVRSKKEIRLVDADADGPQPAARPQGARPQQGQPADRARDHPRPATRSTCPDRWPPPRPQARVPRAG